MKWFFKVLNQDAAFSGRARRKEFWMFVLFYYIFAFAIFLLDSLLVYALSWYNSSYILTFYVLAMIIPWITVSVRRMHDVGYTGWMIFVSFIPIIGTVWYLLLMIKDGDPAENKYGPNPKLQPTTLV